MGPKLVRDTSEKVELIQKRLLMAQSQQKSYADRRRQPLEFEMGDHVFLKVMPKRRGRGGGGGGGGWSQVRQAGKAIAEVY